LLADAVEENFGCWACISCHQFLHQTRPRPAIRDVVVCVNGVIAGAYAVS
jgi:hypothetical protein